MGGWINNAVGWCFLESCAICRGVRTLDPSWLLLALQLHLANIWRELTVGHFIADIIFSVCLKVVYLNSYLILDSYLIVWFSCLDSQIYCTVHKIYKVSLRWNYFIMRGEKRDCGVIQETCSYHKCMQFKNLGSL